MVETYVGSVTLTRGKARDIISYPGIDPCSVLCAHVVDALFKCKCMLRFEHYVRQVFVIHCNARRHVRDIEGKISSASQRPTTTPRCSLPTILQLRDVPVQTPPAADSGSLYPVNGRPPQIEVEAVRPRSDPSTTQRTTA
jgi:hypothetical protein